METERAAVEPGEVGGGVVRRGRGGQRRYWRWRRGGEESLKRETEEAGNFGPVQGRLLKRERRTGQS